MWPFKKQITASEAGKLGNAIKRRNERALIREQADRMRAAMGMPKVEWPE
jgi:hypothetical protein